MYMTRHQRQLSASIDENKVPHVKAVPSKAAGNGKAVGNNRRTLGDIGNLVGALSVRCNVSKDGIVEIPKQEPALDRPITRSFRVNSNGIQKKEIEGEETAWGTKQRRTTITEKVQLPGSALDHGVNVDQVSGPSARVKGVLRRGVAAKKKEPTLTALLTARSQAACGLGDLEMRDAEDPLPDIDQSDSGNQLAVVDYVEDIYSFYKKTEIQSCVSPDYMSKQPDINHKMRAILIDWLIEVHYKFKLMPETLFLTINIIDRFLACESVSRKHLQLVGCTAMLLASKYEEIWAPEVQDFVFISDNAYTKDQVLLMEKRMLNTLSFNLTVPTPYVFMVRLLKAATSDEQMNMLSFFLVELCLTDYTMVKFLPSHLAAAAVYTAHYTLQRPPYWNYVLKRHSGYSEWQLKECATMMVELHKKAAEGSLKVVYKKYSIAKMSSVSLLSPASLPLPSVSSFCS